MRQWINRRRRAGGWLFLLAVGLIALLWWGQSRRPESPNLLTGPTFRTWEGWQVVKQGQADAVIRPGASKNSQPVLALTVVEAPAENWAGIGQQVEIAPLQRYRFTLSYRLAFREQSAAKLVARVTQFDQTGQRLDETEFSPPGPLAGEQDRFKMFAFNFVTDARAETIQIGFGLFGRQETTVEIEAAALQENPTWLRRLGSSFWTAAVALLLIAIAGYLLVQTLWPFRRKILVNGGLVTASILLTLLAAEIIIRFIPVNLVTPNWPRGYHIPFADGSGYRLARNYPPTWVTDAEGDRHLATSNEIGVRDVPLPRDGEPLIVVLGDSMTFGWAVSDIDAAWPRQLDQEIGSLRPALADYHLVNTGVSGYNTFQEVQLLEEVLADMERLDLQPQIALVSFFSGIWERNAFGLEGRFTVLNDAIMYTAVKEELLALPGRLAAESRFDDLKLIHPDLLNRPHRALLLRSRLYFILSLLVLNQMDNDWDPVLDVDLAAKNHEALTRFKQVAEANNIQPLVAYLPADNLFTPGKLEKNRRIVAQLTAICQELDIPFINPYENMQALGVTAENAKETLTLVYNRHYSAAGNQLYARALAPLLAEYLVELEAKK